MTFRNESLKKYIRISLAGFMSVWLSGVVFLFCCEKINGHQVDEVASCPLAQMSDDCPMSKKPAPDAEAVETAQGACADCCAFLPVVFDKTRKIERDQARVAAASNVAIVKIDRPVDLGRWQISSTVYSRASYQTDLSVQNCVFRI